MAFIAGQFKFACDRCGFTHRAPQRRKEWDGLIVDPGCLDPRPAELSAPRVWPEGLPVRDARPDQDGLPDGTFITVPVTRDQL
jgi:hypothetical protein